jgi:HK97 gp10 family phage protein
MLSLTSIGIPEVAGFVKQLERETNQELRGRLKEGAKLMQQHARGETHSRRVSSAMTYDVTVVSRHEFRARIGPTRSGAFFAHFLEFGTSHSRPFPFLLPTVETLVDEVTELVGVPPLLRRRAA